MTQRSTRLLFGVAGLFNFGAVLLFLPSPGIGRAMGLLPVPTGNMFEYVGLAAVFLFGIGYWMVARAPEQNRGIVQLGLAGKILVVSIALAYFFVGTANLRLLGLISGDLVFSVLFAWYLVAEPSDSVQAPRGP